MNFSDLHIKDIHTILLYNTNMKHWDAKNRNNHIVGVKLDGSALHDFGDRKFILSRNCIYFFNKKDDYHVDVYEPGPAFSIHFTTYEKIDTDSFCIPVSNPNEIISLLKKANIASETGDNLMTLSILYKICAYIEQIWQKNYFPKDKRILDAKSYMDTHFKEKDCLSTATSKSGLTPRRFGELFRNNFDTTPNRYIIQRKIDHAKSLLETQVLSIAEVARQSGFSDIYYFSKIFKEHTGISPSKWTQQL